MIKLSNKYILIESLNEITKHEYDLDIIFLDLTKTCVG